MRRVAIAGIAVLLAIPLTVLGASSRAYAAGCVGSSCTGLSAETEGCSADAITAETAYIYDVNDSSQEDGYVQLRYSATCRATWAKVFDFYKPSCTKYACGVDGEAVVERTSTDSPSESCSEANGTLTGNAYVCTTNMINDENVTSVAFGSAPGSDASLNSATTSPY
jgi:hypothetical protein